MKSDVSTPVGLEETIQELWHRNSAVSRARGESPAATGDFVCNSAKGNNYGLIEGRPRPAEFFTTEQLERSGLVGLYRRAQS
jgi:hypothetical protein